MKGEQSANLPVVQPPFDRVVLDDARYYREQDPANRTMGVYSEAIFEALQRPYYRQMVGDWFNLRPEVADQPYALNILKRAYQADLLENSPRNPDEFSKDDLLAYFDALEINHYRWGIWWTNLLGRQVQSNVAERYKSVKLLAKLFADRFDGPPSHLDIGCSLKHGSLKLAFNQSDQLPHMDFQPFEIVEAGSRRTDRRLTELGRRALAAHVAFGDMLGIDITNVDDPVTRQWVRSCSFYPDELRDGLRLAEFNILDGLDRQHQRVGFIRADFADNRQLRAVREAAPDQGFDLITFSTVFYQVSKEERVTMLVNAANLLSDNGLIIIQDARDGNFAKKYNYLTSVIDVQQDAQAEQPLLRWENGRCRRASLELGRVGVAGRRLTVGEALENLAA